MITKYFKPINQPDKQPKATKAKKVVVISSDEEEQSTSRKSDVIPNTPVLNKKKTVSKLVKGKAKQPDLKPAKIESFLSTSPVKQSPVARSSKQTDKKADTTKKRDEAFKQTLEELDNSDMDDIDMVDLDKTIDEAMKENEDATPKKAKASASTPSRKRKAEQSLNESGLDPDQEHYEKRRYSAMLYQQYKNRGGPPNKGQKEMPEGKPDCLKNLCFLKTGILDSLDSEDLDVIVKKHGGRTVKAISRKVNFVLVGDEPGPSKIEKARSFGIPEITENQFLDMILTKSGKAAKYCNNENGDTIQESTSAESPDKSSRRVSPRKKEPSASSSNVTPKKTKLNGKSPLKQSKTPDRNERDSSVKRTTPRKKESSISEDDCKLISKEMKTPTKFENGDSSNILISPRKLTATLLPKKDGTDSSTRRSPRKHMADKSPAKTTKSSSKERQSAKTKQSPFKQKAAKPGKSSAKSELSMKHEETKQFEREITVVSDDDKSWTEKYKPANTKSIMGQQDASSNMQKLKTWLNDWNKNHTGKNKPTLQRPSPWAKNDNGAFFKAALLSGPPGVGKTTTATLVAKELGYDVVEMNASDTRNKKLLHEEISTLLSSKSVASFFKDGNAPTQKHVLLMDEVDGMSGNQDRGGIQELIALIKNTNIPIICMCNDRQHQKIRSLGNYCFDLRFGKIKPEAVLRPLMGICHKEGIKVTPQMITQIFVSSGNDIRQTLNHLSMWSASDKVLSTETVTNETEASKKDVIMGPWEVIRKVFSATEHESMSLSDKSKLFFYDYSIGPLFVQENYLQVKPNCPSNKVLERLALTADSLSKGDILEAKIRSSNNWTLMESQAFHSSVLPGHYMEGHFTGQINFPSWLGKNSKTNKFKRLASELQTHMRLSTTSSKKSLLLDDVYYLRDKIVKPMVNNGTAGVSESLEVMRYYNLIREDLDSVLELSAWSDAPDPMKKVESKVKAAFTRTYNKEGIALPYSINATFSKKKSKATDSEDMYGEEEEILSLSDNEEDDSIANDAMVSLKKPSSKKADKPSAKKADKPTTSKASKGRGGKAKK